jgi:hypothetical protein
MAQLIEKARVSAVQEFAAVLIRRMEAMRSGRCTCGQEAFLKNPQILHEPECPAYYWRQAIRVVELQTEDFMEDVK